MDVVKAAGTHDTTRGHNPEDHNPNFHRRENLRSHMVAIIDHCKTRGTLNIWSFDSCDVRNSTVDAIFDSGLSG
jgi:hypothetical protein